MNNPHRQAVQQYKLIALQTHIESATPYELINLLLQGARSHIASAQGCIQHKQIAEKGQHISKAIGILDGLRSSLDHQQGGEIAANLDKLYDYIQQILFKANLNNDAELLTQANQLLINIHQAWQGIAQNN